MFGIRSRRIRALEARVERLVEQRAEEHKQRVAAVNNLARMAQRHGAKLRTTELDDAARGRYERRIRRLVVACARYRYELAGQQRVADHLSDQLLGSLGYTDAALKMMGVAVPEMDEVGEPGEVIS
ncbi:hypothetical protein U9R90_25110 [Streptomyces sp. E11-3]|uniref:hypothetical protein n=1 Tax=Streptomyces sp. E11-3 TaxID=3110112 RepID=UPI00397EA39E